MTREGYTIRLGMATVVIGFSSLISHPVLAFNRYNDGCQTCHGKFTDGTSTKGSVFLTNNKHEMHRASNEMNTHCDLCHTSGDQRNPFIGSSDGTANNPGVGCTGCHGRYYSVLSKSSGVGLRAHHAANGQMLCRACHPGDPAPLPESVPPVYYGTVDTNADDPCNSGPLFKESWTLNDTLGLDNDGDNLYDGNDPDCGAAPVAVVAWRSVRTHTGVGPLGITLSATDGQAAVEPRIGSGGQLQRIEVTMDGDITKANYVANAATYTGPAGLTVTTSVEGANNEILVLTIAGSVDKSCYTFNISGCCTLKAGSDATCAVVVLGGDVTSSATAATKAVTNTDVTATKAQVGKPVDATTCRFDVNCGGTLVNADISQVKSKVGNTAAACQ
jgi:hypothetical protein